ncbi:MAG TPA: DUF742 domain-containing protein [Nocardia sp.]|uniref:DUF742 domain-containing protein n=1 Tax=Nocardia TaxID=1817 RepID=UPI002458649C|nr:MULTISPECIES: DUF742 domain-containing protein [Nocardia]HLS78904.1 DUF742 domain-containing protein [Nocardia sp.]
MSDPSGDNAYDSTPYDGTPHAGSSYGGPSYDGFAYDDPPYGGASHHEGAGQRGVPYEGSAHRGGYEDDVFDDDFSPRLARPYAVTGGRTEAAVDLPVEALIETVADGFFDAFQQSHARIADLCHTPLSVAEIASELGIALGVARVLIGDLIVDGIVRKHQTLSPEDDRDQWRNLLERTLAGLRAL